MENFQFPFNEITGSATPSTWRDSKEGGFVQAPREIIIDMATADSKIAILVIRNDIFTGLLDSPAHADADPSWLPQGLQAYPPGHRDHPALPSIHRVPDLVFA